MTSIAAGFCRRAATLCVIAGVLWGFAPLGRSQVDQVTVDKMTQGFDAGMAAFQKRDWRGTITEMEKVIALCESFPDKKAMEAPKQKLAPVYYTVGAAAYNVPDYPKCISAFERFIKVFPNNEKVPMARLAIARASFMNKDYDKAAEIFGKLEQYPSLRDQALLIQAQCFKVRDKKPEMMAVVEKLIGGGIKTQAHAGAAVLLAQARAEAAEWDKLEPLIVQLVERRQLVENVVTLNELLVSVGDAQAAKEEYEKATHTYAKVMTPAQIVAFQKERIQTLEKRVAANEAAAARDAEASATILAQNAEVQTELEQARNLMGEFEKLPDFMPALLLRNARCWYGRDRKWESILVYERLLERYPKAAKEREPALFGCLISYADLSQVKTCRQLCARYLAEFPKGEHAGTVAYMQGAVVLESGDLRGAVTLLETLVDSHPDSEYIDQIYLMLGGAQAATGEMDKALATYRTYLSKFPKGVAVEEAAYRAAIIPVFQGKYGEGRTTLEAFLKDQPRSQYAEDAKYRLMVCKYAANLYDEVLADAAKFQQEHPRGVMTAEVLSLKGDCLSAQNKTQEAADAYQGAAKKAGSDEVLEYALLGASKALQKTGDWDAVSKLWQDFIQQKPDHPNVVTGIYWITKAKTRQGKLEEAKQITIDQLKRCLNDRNNESVETLLQQLAQVCLKRPRPVAAEGAPPAKEASAAPPWDALGELYRLLAPLDAIADATGGPRLDYARVELMKLLKKPEDADVLMRKIAGAKPEVLSPQLLALAGEFLQSKGLGVQAEAYYKFLKENHLKSAWLDWAYCGLGGLALAKGDAKQALELYTQAMEEYTGSKVKDSMMGRGIALLELGRPTEAKPLFEQVAGTREWRGETTAQAVYYLGQVEERENRLAEAIAFYQRVFVAYQKYVPWVEKAYIRAAQCFDKLGKRPEAIAHLQELLRNPKLGTEVKSEGRKMLRQWGASE